ncbi:MAG TPA: IclR family transcriptional regulator C-terminal domain-containing protein [Sphingobium sp.]|uniref:IclR family transcriptional regulator n=1 Tax=Sphingobium sp. TaxID=1912891 RepID=UPI002ED39370
MNHVSPSRKDGVTGAQAIRRAVDAVKAVAQLQRSGASLNRVAHATGLSSSTTFRILRSLVEERLLRFDEVDRCYYLGVLAFELGLAAQSENSYRTRWRDTVQEVARRTRFTTYLMANSDSDAVCLLCAQGTEAIRAMPMDEGQRLPLGIGAGSLAILSTYDDEEVEQAINGQGNRLDLYPGGRELAPTILKRVAAARENGFAQSSGSVAQGLTGIGVPILPRQGLIQLAISVSAVVNSINPTEARQLANVISQVIHQTQR